MTPQREAFAIVLAGAILASAGAVLALIDTRLGSWELIVVFLGLDATALSLDAVGVIKIWRSMRACQARLQRRARGYGLPGNGSPGK